MAGQQIDQLAPPEINLAGAFQARLDHPGRQAKFPRDGRQHRRPGQRYTFNGGRGLHLVSQDVEVDLLKQAG